jgi:ABC-2 type transport system permease protein
LVESENGKVEEASGDYAQTEVQSRAAAGVREKKFRAAPKLDRSRIHGLWSLTNRDLRKWYTNPVQLFASMIQPVVWLVLFGKALNFGKFIASAGGSQAAQNEILLGFFGTTSYFSYLACGMLAFVILFTAAFSGLSVVFDRRFGFLNKALSTPVARGTIIMSKVLQSVGRSMAQAAVILVIAVVLGMDTSHLSILGIIAAFTILFLMSMGLSSLFVMFALRSGDWQTQIAIINLINLPLLFASNALFPAKEMPTWLQGVVNVNPVSYANDAVRSLLLGSTANYGLAVDFVYLFGFAAALSAIGIVLSWRFLAK